MTEYYNRWDSHYLWLLQQPVVNYRFKVELLDHNEHSYGEITRDVSSTEHYTINVNKSQGIRRTCSLTMINVERKYLPSVNNPFWYNRKFKLYVGVIDNRNGDTFWFPQGVYVCQTATANRGTVNINGIDKFGFLDGSLNVHMLYYGMTLDAGSKIGEVVRRTLMLEMGDGSSKSVFSSWSPIHGHPIDPKLPIIDKEFEALELPKDIVLNEGQYLGDALSDIATSIGADIYYDVNGRLNLTKIFNDDIPFYYIYSGEYWHFNEIHETYIEPNANYSLDGCNYIVVSTDNADDGEVSTYTAVNDNPQSPLSISSVGYRGDKDNPITYIPPVECIPTIHEWEAPIPNPSYSYKGYVFQFKGTAPSGSTWVEDGYYICIGTGTGNNYAWRPTTLEEINAQVVARNTDYCRQHAEYLLLQKTCPTIAVTFKTNVLPHLDVGVIVTITDSYFGFENEPFLVESVTYDGVDGMDISVVNIQWLPNLSECIAGTTVSNNGTPVTRTVTFDVGEYPIDQPSNVTVPQGDTVIVPSVDYEIEIDGSTYHFSGWQQGSQTDIYVSPSMQVAHPSVYNNRYYGLMATSNITLSARYVINT